MGGWRWGDTKALGNGPVQFPVIFASFVGKAEETEEDESAEHQRPPAEFQRGNSGGARSPNEGREDVDDVPVKVDVRPTLPGVDGLCCDVEVETVS